jgi:hypothetical protein
MVGAIELSSFELALEGSLSESGAIELLVVNSRHSYVHLEVASRPQRF